MNKNLIYAVACLLALPGCESLEPPLVSLGVDDLYVVPRMQTLFFQPAFTGEGYSWTVKTAAGRDSLLAESKDYYFLEARTGVYELTFRVIDPANPVKHDLTICVVDEEVEYSPFIARVYEFCPAPGQFVNGMPLYEEGNTGEIMRQKAEEAISGKNYSGVSLGSFGGYITFGFDHTVVNKPGERDLSIDGNAFNSAAHPGTDAGSCEPGIVMVSFDANQNGQPDDPWYEIDKHPWYTAELATYNYEITYYAPDPAREIARDGNLTDLYYIRWTDNRGGEGYVHKNSFHDQDYYPLWDGRTSWTFRGTLLPPNAEDVSGNGSYYLQYMFPYGAYVDNYPGGALDLEGGNRSSFDIDWAVDPLTRERVSLPGVDFIRVYTALNQYCGWLGETSTEIFHARDHHVYERPARPGE
jgi:hypothetical protein